MEKVFVVGVVTVILLGVVIGIIAIPLMNNKAMVMVGSYDGVWESDSVGGGVVESAEITTDRPALFTVTVSVTGYVDDGDVVWLAQSVNGNDWSTCTNSAITYPNENCKTFTVAGYGVGLTYRDSVAANMKIRYCIIVEGDKDTVVSFRTDS